MAAGHRHGERPARAADIAHAVMFRKIERLGEYREIALLYRCHRREKAFEPLLVGIKGVEQLLAIRLLDLVLRSAGAQRLRDVAGNAVRVAEIDEQFSAICSLESSRPKKFIGLPMSPSNTEDRFTGTCPDSGSKFARLLAALRISNWRESV